MATNLHTRPDWPLEIQDQRWALLQRVASSTAFKKSNRLRELLLFLGERSLREPERSIHELEIGVEVFGRPEGYDTSQDTLVRVQASQLRKKLDQYFAEEGKDEPMLIELPKGAYSPRFVRRASHEIDVPDVGAPAPLKSRLPFFAVFTTLAVVAALIGLAVLLLENRRLRDIAEFGLGSQPKVGQLWKSMFAKGQHTTLVLADGNLVEFQDRIHRMMSLEEYQGRRFERLAQENIADPGVRSVVITASNRQMTHIGDAILARRIGLVCASNSLPIDVVSARDITMSQINQHNAILTGSLRSNPWVGLFEDQLNFHTVFEESPKSASFENRSPMPGEQPRYRGQWGKYAYCRVAYLANPKRTGHVLLISGTDMQSTEAGGDLVTVEAWVTKLRQALKLGDGAEFPYFEALLEGRVMNNTLPQFELVAVRRH